MFQNCKAATMPSNGLQSGVSDRFMLLALDYELPYEFLVAEPPLMPYITNWLSGKRDRRREFTREWKKATGRFHRLPSCESSHRSGAFVTVTSHSLTGKYLLHVFLKAANLQQEYTSTKIYTHVRILSKEVAHKVLEQANGTKG